MKFQFMREKQMTIKKLAAVLLGSIVAISSAQAALISSSIAYGAANAAAAETAFLDGSLSYETEDFNSFIIDSVLSKKCISEVSLHSLPLLELLRF
jgi:hypothetical protein